MAYVFRDDLTMADIAFQAFGRDPVELFSSAWEALLAVMLGENAALGKTTTRDVALENPSLDLLLVEFLSEALFFKDAEGLFLGIDSLSIGGGDGAFRLAARLSGEKADREKHGLGADVKAVTLHRFELERTETGYSATVVLDV
jgi:SHS2 domain-containing protein